MDGRMEIYGRGALSTFLGKTVNADSLALLSRLCSIYIFDLYQLKKLEMLFAIRKIVFWLLKLCKQ
jgi:hypothetical protein